MDENITNAGETLLGLLLILSFLFIIITPFWVIFSKAGLSRWLSFFMVLPVFNIIFLYILAFSKWPALKRKSKE